MNYGEYEKQAKLLMEKHGVPDHLYSVFDSIASKNKHEKFDDLLDDFAKAIETFVEANGTATYEQYFAESEKIRKTVPNYHAIHWDGWMNAYAAGYVGVVKEIQRLVDEFFKTPKWDAAQKIQDWRNHVPEKVRSIWHTLTFEQAKVLYEWAQSQADNEEWE